MQYKAKKSLGQNFLKSEAALKKIVEAGEIKTDDIILEIGPGKGALTKKLLEKAGCVIAVEKDRELFELLKNKFENEIKEKKLILIEDDILKFNITRTIQDVVFKSIAQADEPTCLRRQGIAIRQQANMCGFQNNILNGSLSYKIIANIPYNITGAILKKFLEGDLSTLLKTRIQPMMMVLMVQHEVAKRIVARDEKESILSISVKAYGTPKIEMKVPARYFSPAPKVDSAIISIKNISRNFFIENKIDENEFWQIIHAGFAHKRKKLSSNLKILKNQSGGNYGGNASVVASVVLGNKRAEELSLKDWTQLIPPKSDLGGINKK